MTLAWFEIVALVVSAFYGFLWSWAALYANVRKGDDRFERILGGVIALTSLLAACGILNILMKLIAL